MLRKTKWYIGSSIIGVIIILIGAVVFFLVTKKKEPQQIILEYGSTLPEILSIKNPDGKDTLGFVLSKECSQCVAEFPLIKAMHNSLSSKINVVVFWRNGSNELLGLPESTYVDLKGEYKINSGSFPQDFIADKDGVISFVDDSAGASRLASRIAEKYVTEDVKKDIIKYMASLYGQDKVMFCFETEPMTEQMRKKYSSRYVFIRVGEYSADASTTDMIKDIGSFYRKSLGANTYPTYITYAPGEEPQWLTPTE